MNVLPERILAGKNIVEAQWVDPKRATWDETWMEVAQAIARRSACVRRAAGAVIVSANNQIVSTGYNGPPASMQIPRTATSFNVTAEGIRHTSKTKHIDATCAKDCPRAQPGAENATNDYSNCIALHAEENALLYAGGRAAGGTIYMWPGMSCIHCAKLIAGAGIRRVVALAGYSRDAGRNEQTLSLWAFCGIRFTPWKEKDEGTDEG